MFWAIVKNEKIGPQPDLKGVCPACGAAVRSKCGEVYVWHWAHKKGHNCDSWYEPETEWHLDWKMTFGKENSEKVLKKENKVHRADIYTKNKVVIELQNSSIQTAIISEREKFYGERMLWLINGIHFKTNFIIHELKGGFNKWNSIHNQTESLIGKKLFHWSYTRKSWKKVTNPVFIDFGDDNLFWVKEGMGTKSGYGFFYSKKDFILKYGGDYEFFLRQSELRKQETEKKELEIKRIENKRIMQALKRGVFKNNYINSKKY